MKRLNAHEIMSEPAESLGFNVEDARIGFDAEGQPLLTFIVSREEGYAEGVIHLPASRRDVRSILASKRVRLLTQA